MYIQASPQGGPILREIRFKVKKVIMNIKVSEIQVLCKQTQH